MSWTRLAAFALTYASVVGIGAPAIVVAQPEPQWIEIRVIQVKPEMVDEWRELQKNGVNPALKQAGTPFRFAWHSVLGDTFTWVFVTPIPNFTQYDQTGRVSLSDDLNEDLSECTAGRQVRAFLAQADLTKPLAELPPPPVAIVTSFQLVPGTQAEYRDLAKNYLLPAMDRINAPGYEVYRAIFGGPDEWITVRFADEIAEIDKGPALRRGLDEATRALVAEKLSAIQHNVQRQIQTLDTELSYFTETTSNDEN